MPRLSPLLFSSNRLSMKTEVRDASCLLFSANTTLVYFFASLVTAFYMMHINAGLNYEIETQFSNFIIAAEGCGH